MLPLRRLLEIWLGMVDRVVGRRLVLYGKQRTDPPGAGGERDGICAVFKIYGGCGASDKAG